MAKTTICNNSSKYKKFVTCNKCFIICSKCAKNLFRLRLQQHRFPPDGPLVGFHAERKQTLPQVGRWNLYRYDLLVRQIGRRLVQGAAVYFERRKPTIWQQENGRSTDNNRFHLK